ncbi:MAG: CPBP family intramembrane metalloprotease [Lentisphaeraceae bacterium]|nr:CPBP family intramembrane metalloprotease [Lentisphaeraceae bacterium]
MDYLDDNESRYQRSLTLPLISIGLILGYFVSQAVTFIIAGKITGSEILEMSNSAKFIAISVNAILWILISAIVISNIKLPQIGEKGFSESVKTYFIGVGLLYSAMFLFGIISHFTGFVPKTQEVAEQVKNMSETSLFLAVLGPAFLIPIIEELLFRSLLYRSLKFSLSPLFAAIISATLFGFAHIEPDTIPQLITIGLILSYVYEKSGSIYVPIALHATNNFITIMMLIFGPDLSGV